jgi:xanthine dehydrogenase iron-sulfur cluster and FAD-binding subunit A
MIMAAAALPPDATLDQVRVGLAGNLCRCTGYMGIYRAVKKAQGSRLKAQAKRLKAQDSGRKAQGSRLKAGARTTKKAAV